MSTENLTLNRPFWRTVALGSLIFFLPLSLLLIPSLSGAAGWQLANLRGRSVSHLAAAAAEGLVLYYASTPTDGLLRSSVSATNDETNDRDLWHAADTSLPGHSLWGAPNIRSLAVDPANGRHLLVSVTDAGQTGLYLSTDGGATWQLLRGHLDGNQGSVLAIGPDGPMIVSNGNRLLWTQTVGDVWLDTPVWPPDAGNAAAILVLAPTTGTRGNDLLVLSGSGRLFHLVRDTGDVWTEVAVEAQGTLRTLAAASAQATYVYAAGSAGLFRSDDAGVSWVRVSHRADLQEVDALAVLASDENTLVAVVPGEGVLASHDGGATWHPLDRGLGNVHVTALVLDPANQVFAATNDGIWRYSFK